MLESAEEVASAIRASWVAAALAAGVVVVVAFFIGGLLGAGLALGGGALGVGNLRLAALGLRVAPAAFLGSSLPRLAAITLVLAVLVMVLGPVGVWGLLGLLATHLAQVGATVRVGLRAAAK